MNSIFVVAVSLDQKNLEKLKKYAEVEGEDEVKKAKFALNALVRSSFELAGIDVEYINVG